MPLRSLLLLALLCTPLVQCGQPQAEEPSASPGTRVTGDPFAPLGFFFEENRGQAPAPVRFVAGTPGLGIALDDAGARFQADRGEAPPGQAGEIAMRFVGAAPVRPEAEAPIPGTARYYALPESGASRLLVDDVSLWGRVRYRELYPGIDAVFRGQQGQLRYDFELAPGADPGGIALRFEGAERVAIGRNGDLIVDASGLQLVQRPPLVYQRRGVEVTPIEGHFALREDGAVGFEVGRHDPEAALVIDPLIVPVHSVKRYLRLPDSGLAADASGRIWWAADEAQVCWTQDECPFPLSVADLYVVSPDPNGLQVLHLATGYPLVMSSIAIPTGATGTAYIGGVTIRGSGFEAGLVRAREEAGAWSFDRVVLPAEVGFPVAAVTDVAVAGDSVVAAVLSSKLDGGAVALRLEYLDLELTPRQSVPLDELHVSVVESWGGDLYAAGRLADPNVLDLPCTGCSRPFVAKLAADGTPAAMQVLSDYGAPPAPFVLGGVVDPNRVQIWTPNTVTGLAFDEAGHAVASVVTSRDDEPLGLLWSLEPDLGGTHRVDELPGLVPLAVAVDGAGKRHVTGATGSDGLATPGAQFPTRADVVSMGVWWDPDGYYGAAPQHPLASGYYDGFYARYSADGGLEYLSYLNRSVGRRIAEGFRVAIAGADILASDVPAPEVWGADGIESERGAPSQGTGYLDRVEPEPCVDVPDDPTPCETACLAICADPLPYQQCVATCREVDGVVAFCGDGQVDPGEVCDEGPATLHPSQPAACPYGERESCARCQGCELVAGATAFCGDTVVQTGAGEDCDWGFPASRCLYGETECTRCSPGCRWVPGTLTGYCGDGLPDPNQGEECDDGAGNLGPGDALDCPYGAEHCVYCVECGETPGVPSFCGDGLVDRGEGEGCDEGPANLPPDSPTDCDHGDPACDFCVDCERVSGTTSQCGDGELDGDAGEQCDGSAGCVACRNRVELLHTGPALVELDGEGLYRLVVRNLGATAVPIAAIRFAVSPPLLALDRTVPPGRCRTEGLPPGQLHCGLTDLAAGAETPLDLYLRPTGPRGAVVARAQAHNGPLATPWVEVATQVGATVPDVRISGFPALDLVPPLPDGPVLFDRWKFVVSGPAGLPVGPVDVVIRIPRKGGGLVFGVPTGPSDWGCRGTPGVVACRLATVVGSREGTFHLPSFERANVTAHVRTPGEVNTGDNGWSLH